MIFNLIILLLNYLHINPSCFEMMSFMDGFLPNLPIGIFGLKCFFLNFAALISHQLDQRQKFVFMIFNLIILLLNYILTTSFMDVPLPNLPIGIFGLKFFFNFAALIVITINLTKDRHLFL